ncbi:MAG TPA: N-6 DNA methylase [Microthrixaceae bacterium]|nr:N-6 DNA methylase [Microthrixaceae bacterium]
MTAGAYTAVRTEGALLPPDLLAKIAAGNAELAGLRPEDYGLAPGERVGDAIVRSWTRLTGVWQLFAERLDTAPDSETTFETQTRKHWLVPLLDELGFGTPRVADPVLIDDKTYPISHRAGGVALHLLGARVDLDRRPGHGVRPAHGMMQEFLNRSPDDLWGIVSNGLRLRLLRDSSSLTRQAFCEFDLEAIFRGQQYAEFALCWLVCHATRFAGDPPSSRIVERWSTQARTDGTRALDQLRGGVETAIEALGNGFLADPANEDLRRRLRDGDLAVGEFQHQLLRLVYRLLFLLVAEARGLMAAPGAAPAAVERYRRYYSVTRLADLARRQRGTAHGDLWDGLGVVFGALAGPGLPALGLYGMGSFLWSPNALADLGPASLPNRALLDAISRLTNVTDSGKGRASVRRAVDYRNLGAEELGSVYESLLELHPTFDGTSFALATAAGNERKTTGSYYTPTPLIRVLLDSALDPVLDEAEQAADPEAALLGLKVIDPAAGSGHFLIAAAHRIAHRLAAVRSGESEPAPDELRHALRQVIGHCIYGIDVNPMAVELCKVSLWMEATEPGRPLGFLDHRIVCGNSLLGATPTLIQAGVPDDAFKALTGDDKAWVTTLKKRNKAERLHRNQATLDFGPTTASVVGELAAELARIDAMPDDSVDSIAEQAERFDRLQRSEAAARAKLAGDAWCAAFVATKTKDHPVLTDEAVRTCQRDPAKVPAEVRKVIDDLADQYAFLHLHVAFPDVFTVPDDPAAADNPLTGWSGGFDVVLGNPPWERVKLQEKEWFAVRDPEVAKAANAAARKRLIAKLVDEQPELHAAFLADSRKAEGESTLLRNSGRFPLGGRGDVNTYAVFAELMRNAISPTGRVGVIVPTGIATDDTTKHFFADLVDRASLASLFDFENRLKIFPGIDSRIKFALLTMAGDDRPVAEAEFVFFALDVADLDDPDKRFTLAPEDFALLNPNTRTCPVFRTRRDAEITKAIYRRVPVFRPNVGPSVWGLRVTRVFDLGKDGLTQLLGPDSTDSDRIQVVQAKMFDSFDHRLASVERRPGNASRQLQPVPTAPDLKRCPSVTVTSGMTLPRSVIEESQLADWQASWLLAFADVSSATNHRTMIGAILPFGAPDYTTRIVLGRPLAAQEASFLLACFTSFVFDFQLRLKVGGLHVSDYITYQLPVLPFMPSSTLEGLVLELTFTAWDLEGFAADLGYHGPPFRWDEERRVLLRAELDALMFRLYGIERDDVDYILDTFPIVKRKDEAAFGEYRTKRLILERFDAMAEAETAGREYETVLDPPPADPSCAHPESTRPAWAGVTR